MISGQWVRTAAHQQPTVIIVVKQIMPIFTLAIAAMMIRLGLTTDWLCRKLRQLIALKPSIRSSLHGGPLPVPAAAAVAEAAAAPAPVPAPHLDGPFIGNLFLGP